MELLGGVECDVALALSVLNWLGRDDAEVFLTWAGEHAGVLWAEVPVKSDGRGGAQWLTSFEDTKKWLQYYLTNL